MSKNAAVADESLRPALEVIAHRDADFAAAYEICGLPPVRDGRPGFAGLLSIICAQQVSVHATRAIMGRIRKTIRPLTAKNYISFDDGALRAMGLSGQKVKYSRCLAEDMLSKRLDLKSLQGMDDEEAITHITRVKGLGEWSAHMYLMFALGRSDIWPVGDLAVCVAAQKLKRWRKRPTPERMLKLGKALAPHRTAAARFLWHYYRHPGLPD